MLVSVNTQNAQGAKNLESAKLHVVLTEIGSLEVGGLASSQLSWFLSIAEVIVDLLSFEKEEMVEAPSINIIGCRPLNWPPLPSKAHKFFQASPTKTYLQTQKSCPKITLEDIIYVV